MYTQLYSWDNLLLAFHKAGRGKRGQPNVAAFEHRLEDNLFALQDELLAFTYRPGPYDHFYVHEPKRRLISAAPFRDRVVHHALCSQIEPLFERSFIADSYANRLGKGTHRALDRAQGFARRYAYVLQCDVVQFFPSIDLEILYGLLSRKLDDPGVLWLVQRILEGGANLPAGETSPVYFPGDDLFAALRPTGLPIGNLTSQFWANVYLNPLDHFIKRELRCEGRSPAYLRFVDDILLFGNSKAWLWACKQAIQERLARLRLVIHPGAQPRPVGQGFPFLGFVVYPWRRRLKRRKGLHYQRRLRFLLAACARGDLPFEALNASLRGWVEHARHANTTGLRKAILGAACLKT
ncbi:MAG: reverse transcriptase domain-containing protein [Chloroflexota bacterium]